MDKERQLSQLTLQLSQVSADGDWRALGEIDRQIANLLGKLSRQTLTPTEAERLQELRRAHEVARERCADEATNVDLRLAHMRAYKEGWMAYALASGANEDV